MTSTSAPIPWSDITRFLDQALPPPPSAAPLPSVTLTYAQSLDGKIAGPRGQQLILSGPQSMAMTHQLRTTHDAILVGVQTVLNDNPRLTARMCAPNTPLENPQPVILDSTLKTPLSCALMTARFDNPAAKLPWILTTGQYNLDSKILLEGAGARIFIIDELPAPTDHPDNNSHDHNNGHGNGNNSRIISVKSILQCLGTNGIRRVMVEGGARVIDQFLTYAATTPIRKTQQSNRPDVRCIITVAPKWVGPEGTAVTPRKSPTTETGGAMALPSLALAQVQQLGNDMIIAGTVDSAPQAG